MIIDNAAGLNIESILSLIANNTTISDLHLSWWESIAFRVNGQIIRQEQAWKLTNEAIETILKQLMNGNPKRFEKFQWDKDTDFSYIANDGTAYRVNAFYKTWRIGIVMRKVNNSAKQLEELMFSDIAQSIKTNVLGMRKWLFLVTWPTGSGKSTSLVAMLEYINATRAENLITIEDPIEFVFQPKQCIVSQREIGHDTRWFANALRAAMREDPDVIFVWEIRDRETAEAALSMAETWHLVFSTLHTSSAAMTVNRFISFFPPDIQESIGDRFSDALIGVQSQFLVKSADAKSRIWIYELMINTTAIRNNIKRREIQQMDNIISTWTQQGMITLAQYAQRLIEKWLINQQEVQRVFDQHK